LAWKKANFEKQGFQDKISSVKSLSDFPDWKGAKEKMEKEIQEYKRLKDT
jgi:hypothetical protein